MAGRGGGAVAHVRRGVVPGGGGGGRWLRHRGEGGGVECGEGGPLAAVLLESRGTTRAGDLLQAGVTGRRGGARVLRLLSIGVGRLGGERLGEEQREVRRTLKQLSSF